AGSPTYTADSTSTPACTTLISFTNMVPGDAKLGKVTIKNDHGTTADTNYSGINPWLYTTLSSASNALTTNNASAGGLGLLVFRCVEAPSAADSTTNISSFSEIGCDGTPGGGNSTYILPVYPAASTNPCSLPANSPTIADAYGVQGRAVELAAPFDGTLLSTSLTTANAVVTVATGTHVVA